MGWRAFLVAAMCVTGSSSAAELESFLLPGVDVTDIELQVGRWCRYVVVDEALGEVDSSSFYIAVLGKKTVDGEDAFWLELETGPLGAPPAERDVARALVSGGIRTLAHGDSLYRYVHELYIKKGNEPAQSADPVDVKRLTLAHPTSETHWTRQSGVTIETSMGSIDCDYKELTLEESREIPTGRVMLIRHKRDYFRVWTADEVPIFSLVKCVIERSRESRTIPPVPGIPDAGVRKSRTTAEVVAYGSGAQPILSIP